MKRSDIFRFSLIILFIIFGLFLSMCKKQPEDKVFGGDGRIKGVVLFKNVSTNTLDTAYASVIQFTKDGNAATLFSQTLTNGTFDLTLLQSGNYSFDITYNHPIKGSVNSITYRLVSPVTINLGQSQFIDQYKFTLVPNATSTPTLQIFVSNNGVSVANAQVFVYADTVALRKYRRTGAGSIKSGVTDADGIVVFDNLQTVNYYAASYAVQGTDTLSNIGVGERTPLTTSPLNSNNLNTGSISLVKDILTDSYALTVIVTDPNNAFVPGANVSIYSDKTLFDKNRMTGAGSIASAITGQNGMVKFSGLQGLQYYIAGYKIVVKDTLSNRTTDKNPIGPLSKNFANQSNIILK